MTQPATTFSKSAFHANGILLAWVLAWLLLYMGPLFAQPQNQPVPEQPDPAALELSRELEQRLEAIQSLQGELGLYHPSLIEMYDDLAGFYQQHGDFQQALEMFRQAFQLARINSGLDSEEQLPFIDQVISSSQTLNDWQQVDDMHQLRFYLKNRLYDPGDPRFAAAVDELGRWKLRVMRENLLDEGSRGLGSEAENLSKIYRDSIARIEASTESSKTSLLPLYQGKSEVDLEIARVLSETPYQFFEGTVSRFIYESVCRNVPSPQGGVVRQCSQVRRENPRYRESQRDNKRMMVYRSIREVQTSLQSLNDILVGNPDIPGPEREQIASQIRELEVEYQRIQRNSRRSLLY